MIQHSSKQRTWGGEGLADEWFVTAEWLQSAGSDGSDKAECVVPGFPTYPHGTLGVVSYTHVVIMAVF